MKSVNLRMEGTSAEKMHGWPYVSRIPLNRQAKSALRVNLLTARLRLSKLTTTRRAEEKVSVR
jgi:hypothetical protein